MLKKVLKTLSIVIHDPKVDRAGKALAALVAVRVLILLGASDTIVQLVQKAFGN
jgi:hypothetical protein